MLKVCIQLGKTEPFYFYYSVRDLFFQAPIRHFVETNDVFDVLDFLKPAVLAPHKSSELYTDVMNMKSNTDAHEILTKIETIFGPYYKHSSPPERKTVYAPIVDVTMDKKISNHVEISAEFETESQSEATMKFSCAAFGVSYWNNLTLKLSSNFVKKAGTQQISVPLHVDIQAYVNHYNPNDIRYTATVVGIDPASRHAEGERYYRQIQPATAPKPPSVFLGHEAGNSHVQTIQKNQGVNASSVFSTDSGLSLSIDYSCRAVETLKITFEKAKTGNVDWRLWDEEKTVFSFQEGT